MDSLNLHSSWEVDQLLSGKYLQKYNGCYYKNYATFFVLSVVACVRVFSLFAEETILIGVVLSTTKNLFSELKQKTKWHVRAKKNLSNTHIELSMNQKECNIYNDTNNVDGVTCFIAVILKCMCN